MKSSYRMMNISVLIIHIGQKPDPISTEALKMSIFSIRLSVIKNTWVMYVIYFRCKKNDLFVITNQRVENIEDDESWGAHAPPQGLGTKTCKHDWDWIYELHKH